MNEQTLIHAKQLGDYIRQHGWCQHKPRERDGRVCLRGAMDIVCVKEHPILGPMVFGYVDMVSAIFKETGMYPIEYNDTPGRTKEEILALLDRIAGVLS